MKIRNYVNELFENAPETKSTFELKEELIANLTDKYNDLINNGASEEDSFRVACASVGDIDELIDRVSKSHYSAESLIDQKKRAIRTVIAIALYMMSVLPIIISETLGINEVFALVSLFSMCTVATCLLIYNSMSKPKYQKKSETVVEEFKEWSEEKGNKNEVFKALMGAYWTLVVVVYFLVSFLTRAWYISWVIFLIGMCIQQIINAVYKLTRK